MEPAKAVRQNSIDTELVPEPMSNRATVAIIDDDPAVLDALGMLLRREDLIVRLFASAEDFFASAEPSPQVDIALIDPHLPGMGGVEAINRLNEAYPELPIIGITASPDSEIAHAASRAGARVILAKPVSAEKLIATVMACSTLVTHSPW